MMVPVGKYDFWWLMTTGEFPCPNLTRAKDSRGYIIIIPTERKFYSYRLAEHRVVMEEWLCRKLRRNEIVVHKNGDIADNRLENLTVCTMVEVKKRGKDNG